MSKRRDIHACGPVGDGILPQHSLLRERVELETSLQTIASVEEGVRVTGTESDQTGGQQLILTLQNGDRGMKYVAGGCELIKNVLHTQHQVKIFSAYLKIFDVSSACKVCKYIRMNILSNFTPL